MGISLKETWVSLFNIVIKVIVPNLLSSYKSCMSVRVVGLINK